MFCNTEFDIVEDNVDIVVKTCFLLQPRLVGTLLFLDNFGLDCDRTVVVFSEHVRLFSTLVVSSTTFLFLLLGMTRPSLVDYKNGIKCDIII